MEENVFQQEEKIEGIQAELDDPKVSGNSVLLQEKCEEIRIAQQELDSLYERWQDLEDRK